MYTIPIDIYESSEWSPGSREIGFDRRGSTFWSLKKTRRPDVNTFLQEMKEQSTQFKTEAQPLPAVNPMQNMPVYYCQLSRNQMNWLPYFRYAVLHKKTVTPTDFGIHILCDEILNGYHWKRPQEAMDLLADLWQLAYENDLQLYSPFFLHLVAEFAAYHPAVTMKMAEGYLADLKFGRRSMSMKENTVDFCWLITQHLSDPVLHLSFGECMQLGLSSLGKRKIFQGELKEVFTETVPECVAAADLWYRKRKGASLLEQCDGSMSTYSQTRFFTGFSSKGVPTYHVKTRRRKNRTMDIKWFFQDPEFTELFHTLLDYIEAECLRVWNGKKTSKAFAGLDPELKTVIKTYLQKKKAAADGLPAPEEKDKKEGLQLDMQSVTKLREESELVRSSLKVEESVLVFDQKQLEVFLLQLPSVQQQALRKLEAAGFSADSLDQKTKSALSLAFFRQFGSHLFEEQKLHPSYAALKNAMQILPALQKEESAQTDGPAALLQELSASQKAALLAVLEQDVYRLDEIAMEEMSMPELLLDEINEKALLSIGEIVIDTLSSPPCIIEEFEAAFRQLLQ